MRLNEKLLRRIISDLGLDRPFVKGQEIPVKNCWHFSTAGNAIDAIFEDDNDFVAGMNRVFVVVKGYRVIILAFSLMDTHLHFILYGEWEECNRFMHEYVRRTSSYISAVHGERHKMKNVPIHYQKIDTDRYLKTAICYTIKNAPVAAIPYMGWDYPWSSGPLYFRKASLWSSPAWQDQTRIVPLDDRHIRQRELLRTRNRQKTVCMIGPLVFPGEYVGYEVVEQLFKTCRSFNFFMCTSRESDVESQGGTISRLSIPMQEMRQYKKELCKEMFGVESLRTLHTEDRLRLARALRTKYNSSVKQIARLCGLVYAEVKDRI